MVGSPLGNALQGLKVAHHISVGGEGVVAKPGTAIRFPGTLQLQGIGPTLSAGGRITTQGPPELARRDIAQGGRPGSPFLMIPFPRSPSPSPALPHGSPLNLLVALAASGPLGTQAVLVSSRHVPVEPAVLQRGPSARLRRRLAASFLCGKMPPSYVHTYILGGTTQVASGPAAGPGTQEAHRSGSWQ